MFKQDVSSNGQKVDGCFFFFFATKFNKRTKIGVCLNVERYFFVETSC